jgi:hypothetical protein
VERGEQGRQYCQKEQPSGMAALFGLWFIAGSIRS